MAAETVTFGGGISYAGAQTVYTKARWADEWTQRDDILCTAATWSAQPAVPTASLYRAYGPAKERTIHTPGNRAKLSLEGHFVKIVFACADGNRVWYGYIEIITNDQSGLVGGVACGVQTFQCLGIVNVLAHQLVTTTPYSYRASSTNYVRYGKSGTTFNQVIDGKIFATKGTVRLPKETGGIEAFVHVPKGHYGFDYDQENTTWSTKDICEHLMAFHYPVDEDDEIRIPFEWSDLDLLPVNDKPTVETDHRSLLSIFDELCTGRLMLGYYAEVEEVEDDLDKVILKPYTMLSSSLTLSDSTIAANPRTVDVSTIADQATRVSTTLDLGTKANQVIVRGAKRIVVCSLPFSKGGLSYSGPLVFSPAFDVADLTPQPAATSDPYVNHSNRVQWLNHPNNRLYLRGYVIRSDWDWLLQGSQKIFVDNAAQYFPYPYAMRILDRLPMRAGLDYQSATTDFDLNSTGEYLQPIVYGHRLAYVGTSLERIPGEYILFQGRTKQDLITGLDQIPYDINLEPLPNDGRLGVKLDIDGAAIDTLVDEFSRTAFFPPHPESPHLVKYNRSDLYATIAFEEDRAIEGRFPADADVADVDAVRRRVLEFGDVFQHVTLLTNAVTGIDEDNQTQPLFSDVLLRDDSEKMVDLAKQAYQFYAQDRRVMRLSSSRASAVLDIGKMISLLDPSTSHESPINTVITEITIQTAMGQPGSVRSASFSLTTAAGELDFLAMIPKARV